MASPTNPLLTVTAITLFTEDLPASKAFYTTVFGAKVLVEDAEACTVQFNNTMVNLLVSSSGKDLIHPASVAPPEAGKRFQLTVWVEDLESAMTTLKSKGVVFLMGPETKPWGLRVVTFEDPSGHSWEVAQKV